MATQTYVTDLQAMNPAAVTIQQKPTTTQPNVSAQQQQPQTVQVQKSSPTATIIQPAQAHSGQQQTQTQATSILQPAQAHSGQQFIVAAVGDPNGEQNQSQQETVTLQQGQTVYSHVQYVDGNDPSIYQSSNGQMQTYHDYGQTMYTPVSGTYYQVAPGSQLSGNINQGGTIQTVQGQILQGGTYLIQGGTMDGEGTPLSHTTRASPVTVGFDSPAQVGCDLMENHANVQWLFDNYETAEGVSLPRSTLYNHYLRHCQEENLDPMNPASFGKLIRSVFLGLRTRRLGTRGNSKYHYYGIRIKANSPLNQFTDDQTMAMRQQPMYQGKKFRPKLEDGTHGSVHTPGPLDGPTTQQQQHQQFLGDASGAIPNFGEVEVTEVPLPEGIAVEHVRMFERMYREHSEAIVDVVVNLQFSLIEALWQGFWRTHSEQSLDSDYEKRLSKEKLFAICQYDPVHQWVRKADYAFYQALVEVLIPDVLRPIPSSLTQAIRNFAKSLENWLKGAMLNVPEEMVKTKIGAVSAFAQTLRRYTSLNHLAQAARAVLQNTSQINQMLTDLNRVDFANEQASWVCQCEDGVVHQLEQDFKKTLQQQNSLEQWAVWLEGVVNQVLKSHEGNPNFPKAARQFLLKWSFYSSMVIRDLTLRSAASFGSFHLIRLLYDEYMFYLVEHKVAASTGETPIAVMGEFIDLSSAVAMGSLDSDSGAKSTLKKTNAASLLNPLPAKSTMTVGNIVSTKSITSNVLSSAKNVASGVTVNSIGNAPSAQYTTISANVLNTNIKHVPSSVSANNMGQSSSLHSSNAITTNALTSATKITLSGVNANTVGNVSSTQSSNSSVSSNIHGATTKFTGITVNQASSILGNASGSQASSTAISNVQGTAMKYTLSGINAKTAINNLTTNPASNTSLSANVLTSATKLSGITANTQLGNLSTASSNTTTVMVLAPQSVSSVNTNGIPSRANTPTLSNPTTFTLRNTGNSSLTGTKTIVVMPASSVAGSGDGVSPLKKIKADL